VPVTQYDSYTNEYFINPDGLRQHYRHYNNAPKGAPVVLCMPGLTRNAKDFSGVVTHIADRCQVICVDQRGRGLSDYDPDPSRYDIQTYVSDMVALLDELGVSKIIAFGTSLGGLMTMSLAALYPGVIIGAVINDVGPVLEPKGIARILSYVGKGKPPDNWPDAIAAVKRVNKEVYPTFTETEWESFTKKLYREEDGTLIQEYDPEISKNSATISFDNIQDFWGIFEALYTVPTVVLRGALSDLLSAETLLMMAQRHPSLTPVTVENKGHVPLMTEQESLAAIDGLLKNFL